MEEMWHYLCGAIFINTTSDAFNMPTSYQKWVWEKRGAHLLVHGDAKAEPVTGTVLRTTGPGLADSR